MTMNSVAFDRVAAPLRYSKSIRKRSELNEKQSRYLRDSIMGSHTEQQRERTVALTSR